MRDVPASFKKWLQDNGERIGNSKSLPYFMVDNEKYVGGNTRARFENHKYLYDKQENKPTINTVKFTERQIDDLRTEINGNIKEQFGTEIKNIKIEPNIKNVRTSLNGDIRMNQTQLNNFVSAVQKLRANDLENISQKEIDAVFGVFHEYTHNRTKLTFKDVQNMSNAEVEIMEMFNEIMTKNDVRKFYISLGADEKKLDTMWETLGRSASGYDQYIFNLQALANGVDVSKSKLVETIAKSYYTADISDSVGFLGNVIKECGIDTKKISTDKLAAEIIKSKNVFEFEAFLRKAKIISRKR